MVEADSNLVDTNQIKVRTHDILFAMVIHVYMTPISRVLLGKRIERLLSGMRLK